MENQNMEIKQAIHGLRNEIRAFEADHTHIEATRCREDDR